MVPITFLLQSRMISYNLSMVPGNMLGADLDIWTSQGLHAFQFFSPTAELLSDSLWFSGADRSWAARRFYGRFHQGSTEVSPRFRRSSLTFHQGSTKVFQVSWCVWFSGADPSWAAKRFCGRFPHRFFKLVSQFLNSFFAFFPNGVSFGIFSHSKGLGAK